MKTIGTFAGRIVFLLLIVITQQSASAGGQHNEVVIEGFESPGTIRTSGKVEFVSGADVVTEGARALKMAPGSLVRMSIPARAISKVGWLKIDTFGIHPVLASLEITLTESPGSDRPRAPFTKVGHVNPGKDMLALPLGLLARGYTGAWPRRPVRLELHNTGRGPIVIDNVRLAPPAPAPPGTILLDFGPPNQALWPGFEPAGTIGKSITWSGNHRIFCYSLGYPDPLLGDIAGRSLGHIQKEVVTIQNKFGRAMAWIWLTHYGYSYCPSMEYMARTDNRILLRGKLSPAQMLSPQGLLLGKDQPWTTDWLEKSFIPKIVSTSAINLEKAATRLELTDCQLAAMIVSPRRNRGAVIKYIKNLQQELSRYHRQFVLAGQYRAHCDIAPNEAESKSGLIIFLPPRDEWFNKTYRPAEEHRAGKLKLVAASGSAVTFAFAVAPCKDARLLRASLNNLIEPERGMIPRGNIKIYALKTMPVVHDGLVYYQPFILGKELRNIRAGQTCWFVLRIAVPERTRSGDYQGKITITTGTRTATLDVDLRVEHLEDGKTPAKRTTGVVSTGSCWEVYHALASIIPSLQQYRISGEIFAHLIEAGLNSAGLKGPALDYIRLTVVRSSLFDGLRAYPRLKKPGKALIRLEGAFGVIESHGIQPGTARYRNLAGDLLKASRELALRGKISDYALFCGDAYRSDYVDKIVARVEAIRHAGGKAAMGINASFINAMPADKQSRLLGALDTLLCRANHTSMARIASRFKKGHPEKTLAVFLTFPDVYTAGFYSWAIGADGFYTYQVFYYKPLFNAFCFSPRSLLLPEQSLGRFVPTLALLNLQRAIDDYDLLCRCERLCMEAKQKSIDTTGLQKILDEIRLTASRRPPRFNPALLRSEVVPPSQLEKWREALIRSAGEITRQLKK